MNTKTLVNGERTDCPPAHGRAFAYGDGLFETVAVRDGRPLLWQWHMQRLLRGCRKLGMDPPDIGLLEKETQSLLDAAAAQVIKIIISRGPGIGPGAAGYRPPINTRPTRVVMRRDWPDRRGAYAAQGVRVRLCETRLAAQPILAGIKHLNRLEQVLARAEWDDDTVQEGLMRDRNDHIIEGTMSNVFIVRAGGLATPALDRCGVAGVQRRHVMAIAADLGLAVDSRVIPLAAALECEEMFLTNSLIGVWPVREFAGRELRLGEITRRIQQAVSQAWL